jgi:hypothetical protein
MSIFITFFLQLAPICILQAARPFKIRAHLMSKATQQKRALMKPCLCALPRQKAVNYHFAVIRRATLAGRKKFNKCARPNTCPRAATFNMERIDAKARACFQLWLGDSSARPPARLLGISISVGKELVRRSAACVDGFRICKCPRHRGDQHAYCARVTRVSVLPISLHFPQPFHCHSLTDNHAICKSSAR